VKWVWAEPYGKLALDPDRPDISPKCFGLNNLNFGNPNYDQKVNVNVGNGTCEVRWHYRNMPEDGTYAVIDELKISNKDRVLVDPVGSSLPPPIPGCPPSSPGVPDWNRDRITRRGGGATKPGEMTLSRYYLPINPFPGVAPEAGGPPTFTSQTLLQARKGSSKLIGSEQVAVVRVSWNVFTPRFMCEYMLPAARAWLPTPVQYITNYAGGGQTLYNFPIKGPFNYDKYNNDSDQGLDVVANPIGSGSAYGVNRPAPWNYPTGLEQANRGVEIELLQGPLLTPTVLGNKTFTDPTGLNALGTPDAPVKVPPSELRYRVRFMYPVDRLCDSNGGLPGPDGKPRVNAGTQYLLDTPVFDDISVTFAMPVRLLAFREVLE
jgi:hypothetical protein